MAEVTTLRRPKPQIGSPDNGDELTMTEGEFMSWCDEDVRAEFVDGKVEIIMSGNEDHEDIAGFLFTLFNLFVQQKKLGKVFASNFTMRLRSELRRIPDLHFISTSRLSKIHRTEVDGSSDLAVEVVSEDSVDKDRRVKFSEYEKAGVREYWIVDPEYRRMDAYVLNEQNQYEPLKLEEGAYRSKVLPGLWIRPEWLWQRPLPNVLDIAKEIGIV